MSVIFQYYPEPEQPIIFMKKHCPLPEYLLILNIPIIVCFLWFLVEVPVAIQPPCLPVIYTLDYCVYEMASFWFLRIWMLFSMRKKALRLAGTAQSKYSAPSRGGAGGGGASIQGHREGVAGGQVASSSQPTMAHNLRISRELTKALSKCGRI